MTAKAALIKALLDGRVLNVKNCFNTIGITNCSREIGRAIERDRSVTKNKNDSGFGVEVTRTDRNGVSRYGQPCVWTDYRLFSTERNRIGIQKMREYLAENMDEYRPKQKEKTIQQDIFSEL